jgi:predicted MPP superfamily phosphohydrolase
MADLEAIGVCPVLAGHTHGGQVRIPGLGALYNSTWIGRKFDRGLFDFKGVPLYITAGVGTSIVPIRLFDPPEVTLVTVTR